MKWRNDNCAVRHNTPVAESGGGLIPSHTGRNPRFSFYVTNISIPNGMKSDAVMYHIKLDESCAVKHNIMVKESCAVRHNIMVAENGGGFIPSHTGRNPRFSFCVTNINIPNGMNSDAVMYNTISENPSAVRHNIMVKESCAVRHNIMVAENGGGFIPSHTGRNPRFSFCVTNISIPIGMNCKAAYFSKQISNSISELI